MIIKALNTFKGILDLSALERIQESNSVEKKELRIHIRPGQQIEVDDSCYYLKRVQDAIKLGYIQVGNIPNTPNLNYNLIDLSYSGITLSQTAGEDLIIGDLVYYNSNGKVYKAKADSAITMICMGIATHNALANHNVILLIEGLMRNSLAFNFITGGQTSSNSSIVYVSDLISGKVTQTRPTVSSHFVQIIGYAITPDVLQFKPDYTYIELA